MAYLNHAGTSWPKPGPVREAAAAALSSEPESWAASFEEAHRAVAGAFGVADPARLLLTPGCTSALAVAVADHPWERGDRVVISALEHHALHRPVLQLAAQGVEVVVAPRTQEGPLDLDAVASILRGGRVRMVAMTAACNVTGELLPVAEIVALAHQHAALVLVDAAQVAGWLPLELDAIGADLVAFAGHKGPQAPWGVGGLYVAPHVRTTTPAAACALPAPSAAQPCATMPSYCDVGSVDRAALAGLAAGLRWLAEPARADRLAVARARIEGLQRAAAELPGVTLHGAPDVSARVPTLALTVAGRAPAELSKALEARGVFASAGLLCAPLAHEALSTAPQGVLRLSLGPTSSDADVDHALVALREVLG